MNYKLNKYNELCFKKLKTKKKRLNKKKRKNLRLLKDRNDYKFLKIPYKFDYYELLEKIHKKFSHCSYKILVKEFYNKGYTYNGIINDCKALIKSCLICEQKKKRIFKKRAN